MYSLNNKLILLYGKAGCGKSTIAKLFLDNNKKSIYMNLEDKKYNTNDLIKNIIDNDIIVVDYIELMHLNNNKIELLKKMIENNNKTLVLVSCCSSDNNIFDKMNKQKQIFDMILLVDN